MRVEEVGPGIVAFVRPEEGANAGLIRTAHGVIVVDTTSSAADMQELLDAVGVPPSEVSLVINTHFHSDHTWGNQLFDCPILAHRLCREEMVVRIDDAWSRAAIDEYIIERGKTDPQWAREAKEKLADLRVTLPTEVFDERRDLEIGGVRLEVIHFGAHTPGSAVVRLPEGRVLFAGDLIFEGRYPYLLDADVPALIDALELLPGFGARTIVPGHGVLCGETEITALVDYLKTTWERTGHHLTQGHSEDEAAADPDYPRYHDRFAERFHEENIRRMYTQQSGQSKNDT
jgi:cyclase